MTIRHNHHCSNHSSDFFVTDQIDLAGIFMPLTQNLDRPPVPRGTMDILSISQDSAWCDLWQFRCLREVLLVSPSVAQCGQSKIPAASLLFRVNSTVISAVCQNCYSGSVHLKPKGNQTSLIWGHPNFKNTLTYHQKVLGAKLYPAMNLQSGRRPEVKMYHPITGWLDGFTGKNICKKRIWSWACNTSRCVYAERVLFAGVLEAT